MSAAPNRKLAAVSVALFFANVWGTSYVWQFAEGTWAEAPTGITSFVLGVATLIMFAAATDPAEADPCDYCGDSNPRSRALCCPADVATPTAGTPTP